jgi:hypothetical protein
MEKTMESNFTQQDAFAVMHMTRLWRDLNSEIAEANQRLEEHLKLLERCIEKIHEMQEEEAWIEDIGGRDGR